MPGWWNTGKKQVDEDDEDRDNLPTHAKDSFDDRGSGLFGFHLARAARALHAAGREIDSEEPDADWVEANVNAASQSVERGRKIVETDIEKRNQDHPEDEGKRGLDRRGES